ncbi:Retrovirus-related Pol polyprotein from transposon opus [Araneus ventricosus]|uniref:RNA-directed DNA polymerase n=1 Tax=Araneus ventricosus TaxID=182803 RepID=A0A4Y2L420_ARAVE|nr:Retrovirus-related Pol polyprotein from transposon opus [Araneus ventricosus]
MDDLLHAAKHTPFMTTIDLKSGYHQISIDIIVLSETSEKHLDDLRAGFERLLLFKLQANRSKYNFACERVKYLEHYITSSGVQVDPDKAAAIREMVPPKNVKQVQSFMQTCSWYRRFISNFTKKSRPLSNLTKKNAPWKWEEEEQKAFNTLTQCLKTAPILKQVDDTKPFVIRTDTSNYAIGAVLLHGSGADEHPIEYASRLLNSAERNYSGERSARRSLDPQ